MSRRGAPCLGILGRLFGHRFFKMTDSRYDYCRRCGMPRGGWLS